MVFFTAYHMQLISTQIIPLIFVRYFFHHSQWILNFSLIKTVSGKLVFKYSADTAFLKIYLTILRKKHEYKLVASHSFTVYIHENWPYPIFPYINTKLT